MLLIRAAEFTTPRKFGDVDWIADKLKAAQIDPSKVVKRERENGDVVYYKDQAECDAQEARK